jgi:hypothetical protein
MRIATDSAPPTSPAKIENTKYTVPTSLWFVENSQRLMNRGLWSSGTVVEIDIA